MTAILVAIALAQPQQPVWPSRSWSQVRQQYQQPPYQQPVYQVPYQPPAMQTPAYQPSAAPRVTAPASAVRQQEPRVISVGAYCAPSG